MKPVIALSVLTLALVGCGGGSGGGSSSGSGTTPVQQEFVTIDSANSKKVAGSAYEASKDTGSLRSTSPNSFQSASASNNQSAQSLLGEAVEKLNWLSEQQTVKAQQGLIATKATHTAQCDNGGSITVNYPDNIESGSVMSASMSNCLLDGETSNGSIKFTYGDFDNSQKFSVEIVFDAYSIVSSSQNSYYNGTMAMSFDASASPLMRYTMTANALTLREDNEETIIDTMSLVQTINGSEYSIDDDMTITNAKLGGKVTIATDPSFVGSFQNAYPDTGKMRISGKDNSYVEINADTGDNNTVQISTSQGTSEIIPWSELNITQ